MDDYFVKVLTLKEPSSQSFPLIFKQLLEVEANFIICTEWHPEWQQQNPEGDSKQTPALSQLQDFDFEPSQPAPRFPTER